MYDPNFDRIKIGIESEKMDSRLVTLSISHQMVTVSGTQMAQATTAQSLLSVGR